MKVLRLKMLGSLNLKEQTQRKCYFQQVSHVSAELKQKKVKYS